MFENVLMYSIAIVQSFKYMWVGVNRNAGKHLNIKIARMELKTRIHTHEIEKKICTSKKSKKAQKLSFRNPFFNNDFNIFSRLFWILEMRRKTISLLDQFFSYSYGLKTKMCENSVKAFENISCLNVKRTRH